MLDRVAITREAQKYTAEGQIEKAITTWQKLLMEEEDGSVYNVIGDLYLRKKDYENALQAFKRAANIFREDGFYLKAIALYKKILNINPSDVSSLIALGKLNAEKGLIGNAIENFLSAAQIFVKEGAVEKELDMYKRILKLTPSDIPLRIKASELSLKMGLREEAIDEYLEIAKEYLNKGEHDKAKEFYQKAVDMGLQNASAHTLLNYSRVAIGLGYVNDAKEVLVRLTEIYPSNTEYKRLLGSIYLKEGLSGKAWEELLPCIDEAISLKRWDEAAGLLGNFTDVDPMAVERRLITIYIGKGDKDVARKKLYGLAELYEGKGHLEDAIQLYKELLELNPSDDVAKEKVRELRDVLGIKEEVTPPEPLEEEPLAFQPISPETLEEELADAEFYVEHGLKDEAIKIYERLLSIFPDNEEISERLSALRRPEEKPEEEEEDNVVKYDLAEVYMKNRDYNNAFTLYMEIYTRDPDFRDVSSKIEMLKRLTSEPKDKIRTKRSRVSYI